MYPTLLFIGLTIAAKLIELLSVYTLNVSSTSFDDAMCLVGQIWHTFIDGTHSIIVCG